MEEASEGPLLLLQIVATWKVDFSCVGGAIGSFTQPRMILHKPRTKIDWTILAPPPPEMAHFTHQIP